MNNSNDFVMGTTRVNPGQSGLKFFYLVPGDNLYRVLPPMFSLAQDGAISHWWATHRGFRNTKGKQRSFACPQDKDNKTKQITVRCAICDAAAQVKLLLDAAKTNGATKEQLQNAEKTQLAPLKCEKGFWLNVINANGEVGIMSINYKLHETLKALLNTQFAAGFDPTGANGCYLNFKKIQQYKGDSQTTYTVEIAVEQTMENGIPSMRPKMHTLTPDLINRIKSSSRDLGKLFPSITPEQAAILVQLTGNEQAVALEKFLGGPEKEEEPVTPHAITIPGTTAQALVTPVSNGGNLTLTAFGQPTPAAAPTVPVAPVAQPVAAPVVPAAVVAPAPVAAPVAAPTLPPGFGSAAPAAAPTTMSDADFMKMFQPNRG